MPETNTNIVLRRPVADAWPITTHFGEVFDGGPSDGHRGVDFGVPVGTPVYACAAGRVVQFVNVPTADYPMGTFGNGVCIDHPGTVWYSLVAHLSQILVPIGAEVKQGDLVGLSGNTGMSTGPHVHWQLCRSSAFPVDISQSADPLQYVTATVAPPAAPQEETMSLTEADVRRIVHEELAAAASNDQVESSTAVLSIVAQAVGAVPSTYTDPAAVELVEKIQAAVRS